MSSKKRRKVSESTKDNNEDNVESVHVKKLQRKSIERAVELIARARATKTKEQVAESDVKKYCIVGAASRSHGPATGTSSTHKFNRANRELYSCLARQDWNSLLKVFPSITKNCLNIFEPILWRYVMISLLCPVSTVYDLQNFFEMCLSCQENEGGTALEKMLTLYARDYNEKSSK